MEKEQREMLIGHIGIARLLCKYTLETDDEGRRTLSIQGDIIDKANGSSGGQIDQRFEHRDPKDNDSRYGSLTKASEIDFVAGWNAERWLDFLDIWHRWHLNDMRAECEHQRKLGWDPSKPVTLYHFTLGADTYNSIRATEAAMKQALKEGKKFTPTAEQTKLACLDMSQVYHKPDLPEDLRPYYVPTEKSHYRPPVETKTAGWVTEAEHPDGILSKPCPVCGHKYGHAWLYEELPQSVVDFLHAAFPEPKNDTSI